MIPACFPSDQVQTAQAWTSKAALRGMCPDVISVFTMSAAALSSIAVSGFVFVLRVLLILHPEIVIGSPQ